MKKTRMATGLLQNLKEANAIECGKLEGREIARRLSRPSPIGSTFPSALFLS